MNNLSNFLSDIAQYIASQLEKEGIIYCYLTDAIENISRDIDLIIEGKNLDKATMILIRCLSEKQFSLINRIKNSYSTQLFFWDGERVVQIDLMPTISYRGIEYFSIEKLLQNYREKNGDVYVTAKPAFWLYCMARDLFQKGNISDNLKNTCRQLPEVDKNRCFQIVNQLIVSKALVKSINLLLTSGECNTNKKKLWRALLLNQFLSNPYRLVVDLFRHGWLLLLRYLYPPGLMLVFLGPDGVGKTTVIEKLKESPLFEKKQQYYLLPGFLSRYRQADSGPRVVNTDPHGRPPRNKLFSMVKQFVWLAEYILGYYFIVKKDLFHNKLVLFDRYYYDMLVDKKRYRYNGPDWLLKLCSKLVPAPDLLIVLTAPVEVIYERKQEVCISEIKTQVNLYTQLNFHNKNIVRTHASINNIIDTLESIALSSMRTRNYEN